MASRFRRLFSFNSDSSSNNIVNSHELRTKQTFNAPNPDNYANWSLPRIEMDTIYKIGTFDFIKAYSCKTHEEVISLQNGLQTIDMIKQQSIESHLQAKYRFMHIGLVQVAIKPLVRKGINAPIYLALRDKRLRRYKSSLLALIQTNICKGPVFFNCFPDFMVDLTCPMTTEALKLDVHIQGNEFLDFKNFVVLYRVYFRLMSTNLNTRFLNPLPSNSQETILLQIEDDKPTVFTPTLLKWDEITLPDELELHEPQSSSHIERRDIDQIIEEPDGRVLLKFRSLSIREEFPKPPPSNYRRSFSDTSSNYEPLDHTTRYRFRNPIPEPVHDPPSPTSSGIGAAINVLTNLNFQINWDIIKEDYYSQKNSSLRRWFEQFDRKVMEDVKKEWISDMNRLKTNIPFFIWFLTFASKYGISQPYQIPSLNVQTSLLKVWHLTNGSSISAVHPPKDDLKILLKGETLLCTPFRKGREGSEAVKCDDLLKVHQQVNYTNSILQTIADQLNQVSSQVAETKRQQKSSKIDAEEIQQPFFKMDSIPKAKLTSFHQASSSNDQYLKLIADQLRTLDVSSKQPSTSCLDKTCQLNQSETTSSEDSSDDSNSEQEAIQVLEQISEEPTSVNKIRNWFGDPKKNFYPKPTPPDIQYEERGTFASSSFDGHSLHQWNIDGKSEHEILSTVQEMWMAHNAYKAKGYKDSDIAVGLVVGFTGQLKNWWDHTFSEKERNDILNHKVVKTEDGMTTEETDCVQTLLHAITLHFLGNPKDEQAVAKTVLINLRCPTLSDYRWYKDVFLTLVLKREDCVQDFWKERFIAGLPKLFGERILNKLRQHFGTNDIPFSLLTFGQLFGIVKSEALNLCNELKLQSKYGSERAQSRKEMGTFCEAFGITKIEAPSTARRKAHKRLNKSKQKPPVRQPKPFHKRETKPIKAQQRKPNKTKKPIVCYKCGKTGHKAIQCKTEQKIHELFSEDPKLKQKLLSLLITKAPDIDHEDEYYAESSNDDSEYESSPIQTINVITSKDQKEFLIELIGQIADADTKREYLQRLKELILEEDKPPRLSFGTASSSSFNQILNNYPFPNPFQQVSTKQIQAEINDLKGQIRLLKDEVLVLKTKDLEIEAKLAMLKDLTIQPLPIEENSPEISESEIPQTQFLQTISKITFQKWYSVVKLVVEDFSINVIALIDSGADQNCIKEGIVPTKYCERTREQLASASGDPLSIRYKLNKGYIQNNNYCFKNVFLIVANLTNDVILGTPFLTQIYPFTVTQRGVHTTIVGNLITFPFLTSARQKEVMELQSSSIFQQINCLQTKQNLIQHLQEEISFKRIDEQLQKPSLQTRILDLEKNFKSQICSDLPTAFWERKKHVVSLPYEPGFDERNIPTKARPTQMNFELLEFCKKEIQSLIDKNLIRPSKSPWSCAAFYVNNAAEKERGVPRLVINYKPLNKVLQWIRYPIPNKRDLLNRLHDAKLFSKFDMKSGFWQIQIAEHDRYKTAFTVPFGHYEWNVMPFGLKNAPSEFQNIMNDIFTPYTKFILVYIDDVLVFSKTIDQHFKHLDHFFKIIKRNGLALSASKMLLFQTKIRFLGHDIFQGTIKPIQRSLVFAEKFPDEIKDKNQLQRFLGCLNYVSDFFPHLKQLCAPLYNRLRKKPKPWSYEHTNIVRQIKERIKSLPCLYLPNPTAFMIVETDASDIGYGGILKQRCASQNKEQLVRYHSGLWISAQQNYSTIKKEILAIVLCILKFQDGLYFKKFLLRIDCKSAKEILLKDVKNLVSKQIFARWQAILSAFDFDIEFIKGDSNSLPDFLTREFLQGKSDTKSFLQESV